LNPNWIKVYTVQLFDSDHDVSLDSVSSFSRSQIIANSVNLD